jgi:hypothetical protein
VLILHSIRGWSTVFSWTFATLGLQIALLSRPKAAVDEFGPPSDSKLACWLKRELAARRSDSRVERLDLQMREPIPTPVQ